MATQYTSILKLALPVQGELSGTWGDAVNDQVTSMIEEAIAGLKTINTWSTNSATLSTADGSTSESRAAILNLTDTTSDLSGAATLICPAASKVYIVKNATGQAVTVKTASGTGIAIPNGTTGFVFCDGTNVVEAINNITGNLNVGGNASIGGNLTVTGTTTFNGGTLTLGDANTDNIVFGGEVDSNIIPDDDGTYDLGSSSKEWKDIYIDGVAYLDAINFNGTAISSTAAELNIMDGDTSATSTTLADADRVVVNDAGTMKQVALTDFETYFESVLDTLSNVTTVGALNSGSITSGFGTIDTGSSTITTTGLITGGSLDIDDVVINGTTIGHTDDTDLITVANGAATIAGDLTVSKLKMPDNTSSKLLIADGTSYEEKAVGDLSEISSVANDDVFLAVDTSGGGLKKITRSTIVSGLAVGGVAISNIVEDTTPQLGGDLDVNGNDIVSTSNGNITITPNGSGVVRLDGNVDIQSGTIDLKNSGSRSKINFYCESGNAHAQALQAAPHSESASNTLTLPSTGGDVDLVSTASTATLTNKTFGDNVSFGDNNITNVGDIALDSISADGTDINVAVSDNSATAFTIKQGSDNYFVVDTGNSSESIAIGTGISGTAITLGHSTSEVTVADNLTVTGNLTVNGDTTTVDTTNTTVKDTLLGLNSGASSNSNDVGIIIERGSTGNDALFIWDESEDKFALGTTTDNASSTGNLNMTTGTLVANIEGNVTGTASVATTVTISDNESTDEDNAIVFTSGGDVDGGNIGLESDGDLTYNPSTGRLTATQLAGTLQTAAQANVTSLGTLTTLTVDNVIINGSTIGHTGDTDLMTVASGILTVAGEVSMTTLDIGGTNVTATAAELNYVDGVTSAIQTQLNTKASKGFATAMAIAL